MTNFGRLAAMVACSLVLVAGEVWAEPIERLVPIGQLEPTDPGRFTIELLTMFPGDDLTTMTGHSGLRVIDAESRTDQVFNWGALDWTSDLPVRFMRGPLRYYLAVYSYQETMAIYVAEDRTVLGQRLDLSQNQAARLVLAIDENAQLENREYDYHHFHDNCSTRIRDVIDRFSDGALREQGRRPTGQTFREQGYWGTGLPSGLMLVFDLIANESWDRQTTAWESTFLPLNLHAEVARARIGGRPLVYTQYTYHARSIAEPSEGRFRPTVYVMSLPALLLLVALIVARLGRPRWRVWAKVGFVVLGLVAGLGALLACVAWLLTDHSDFARNQVLFHLWPTDLALIVLGPKSLGSKPRLLRGLSSYLVVRLVVSVMALVLLATGVLGQQVWSMAVPTALALALALVILRSTSGEKPERATSRRRR